MKTNSTITINAFNAKCSKFSRSRSKSNGPSKIPTSNRVTDKVAIITYSRPQLKIVLLMTLSLKIKFGELVNEATELRLFNDVKLTIQLLLQELIPCLQFLKVKVTLS